MMKKSNKFEMIKKFEEITNKNLNNHLYSLYEIKIYKNQIKIITKKLSIS